MTVITSTAYSRDLGDELRRLRESCTEFGGRALAIRLGWDPSKVSNIEHGKARASEIDLVQFLMMCGKDTDYFEEFRRRYRYAFEEYVVQVSDNVRTLALAESTAKKMLNYDTLTVPGLMQTESYADALYRAAGVVTEERIPALVRARMDRQAVLRRHNRPDCLFFIHEIALRQRVGDERIMADQYRRLYANARFVRIVPADVLVNSAGIRLWEYEKAMPVAYTETDVTQVFAQDLAVIARTRLIFNRVEHVALDEEQSRSKLMEYISSPREDLDDAGPHLA
ncbi:helix-turn-helix domain-containing protein [Lentzea sp. NPDC051213]|uniref:helix-turn-helix domain-containing protein n=1 Tax=Lentzea sp. NPDC051213 TaxID=3364126 RepID=UPI00379FF973